MLCLLDHLHGMIHFILAFLLSLTDFSCQAMMMMIPPNSLRGNHQRLSRSSTCHQRIIPTSSIFSSDSEATTPKASNT